MEKTLQVLNELEQQGVFARYAIGGAMAALFYMEPLLTYDLDVFVTWPPSPTQSLLSLDAIYRALEERGHNAEDEHVLIEGIPVQLLPAFNPLLEEALEAAREVTYRETPTRVLRAEHLLVIMLQTGRPKDRERFQALLAEAVVERPILEALVQRFGLEERWRSWIR
jgi:hypothetical protein